MMMFPAMIVRYEMGWTEMLLIDLPAFFLATFSVANFYAFSQKEAYPDSWKGRLKYLPAVMAVGIGLTINNLRAVLEAAMGQQSEFNRTPKYGINTEAGEPALMAGTRPTRRRRHARAGPDILQRGQGRVLCGAVRTAGLSAIRSP